MRATDPSEMLRAGTLDASTMALLWLLSDGGVPLVVAGPASAPQRAALGSALLSMSPARPWVLLEADEEELTTERLAAFLRGGTAVGITLAAPDLEGVLQALADRGLPEDAIRRLGIVVIAEPAGERLRCRVVHYLRPTERDAQGHLQRRPPAVLSAWDERGDIFEDFGWGITPELADRVDRAQADLEERRAERADFLLGLEASVPYAEQARDYLATEPPSVPAPPHPPARPSPFSGGLIDPEPHGHGH